MSVAAKLAAYGAALALIVIGAFAVGTAVGPLSPATAPAGVGGHMDASSGTVAEAGLASSSGGYTLTPTDATLTPGIPEIFAFRVTGPDGTALTAFEVEHDKRMHLIVVRRDGTGFQHVHPVGAPADGVPAFGPQVEFLAEVPSAGTYRLFLDFRHAGAEHTAEFTVSTGPTDPAPAGHTEPPGAPAHGH